MFTNKYKKDKESNVIYKYKGRKKSNRKPAIRVCRELRVRETFEPKAIVCSLNSPLNSISFYKVVYR